MLYLFIHVRQHDSNAMYRASVKTFAYKLRSPAGRKRQEMSSTVLLFIVHALQTSEGVEEKRERTRETESVSDQIKRVSVKSCPVPVTPLREHVTEYLIS